MFCQENKDASIPCSMKWVYQIISFISLLCSFFVVYVTIKRIKMTIMHILVLQIIISEIVDEVNILLGIISDIKGKLNFENYGFRMQICYPQLFLSSFSCLWTLTASFFISLKLYDIIINNNKLFRGNNFLNKNVKLISVSIPLIISYILWAINLTMNDKRISLNSIYENKIQNRQQRIQLVFCWLAKEPSIAIAIIASLLILANLYFSIRSYWFLRNMKNSILNNNDDISKAINNQINNINQIQKIIFLYPIIACLIWSFFFLFIFLVYFDYRNNDNFRWAIVFCIFMSIRQIIYTLVYFLSQQKLRKYTLLILMCKTCKRNKSKGAINPIKLLPNSNIINDNIDDN